MKVHFGGVRGTAAITDTAFAHYGGDTTAFLIESEKGQRILIDFGSGVRAFRNETASNANIHVALLTHYHLDHLNGFPVFERIYDPEWHARIMGPPSDGMGIRDIFSNILARPFWPMQVDMLSAHIEFETLPSEYTSQSRHLEDLTLSWCPVHHPGGCLAYRLDEKTTNQSVIIATDMEWQASTPEEKAQFITLCTSPSPANCLLFDGHFMPENYATHHNWGHSTWQDAVEIHQLTNIENIRIIHHAPAASDTALADIDQSVHAAHPYIRFARQGDMLIPDS
ncbi:MAG: MBL fold metallo-hydrolase [Spartobacteria bacterium]|nr:MBL fold metallo-hydrolase [Spartobacteria bacterium]